MRGSSSSARDKDISKAGVPDFKKNGKESNANGPFSKPVPATTANSRKGGIKIVEDPENFERDDNQRKKASDYSKRRDSKRSSTAVSSKTIISQNSKNSSSDNSRRRTASYAVKSKKLPPNFAENVLDLELLID